MFTRRSRMDKPLEKLEAWIDSIWWPSTIGRLPDNVRVNSRCDILLTSTSSMQFVSGGGGKADQWRNLGSVLVPALYVAWQINGEIPES